VRSRRFFCSTGRFGFRGADGHDETNSGQLAPRDTQLRGFNFIALEERQSFAPCNRYEPTGAFTPFQDAATTQHDAGVFAAQKRRLNWLDNSDFHPNRNP
jgi:hypothetical protein